MNKHEQLELPIEANEELDAELGMLKQLVTDYAKNKGDMDNLKKKVDDANKRIKEKMTSLNLSEIDVNGVKATFTVQERTSFMDEPLLLKVKSLGVADDVVRTREYVDMDALENIIYHGKISAVDLIDCQSVQRVEVLRISKGR